MTLRRERYALDSDGPIVAKENEGFASYVVLPQFFNVVGHLKRKANECSTKCSPSSECG